MIRVLHFMDVRSPLISFKRVTGPLTSAGSHDDCCKRVESVLPSRQEPVLLGVLI